MPEAKNSIAKYLSLSVVGAKPKTDKLPFANN